ncbi:MAG TPA: acyltransferase [Terriglobales bacterium]|jgi:acetyltransferase-like isoleucine patch superfamily enzyme|nr:acyltransferase [Terriglobales bacterium]
MKRLGRWFLLGYRTCIRLNSKYFSLLISGAFAQFGKKTVLMPPLRVSGESRIALGDRVFIGPGSWLQASEEKAPPGVKITIGSGTSIVGDCVISAVQSVCLEENVLLARNVYISDHIHKYTDTSCPILEQGVDKVKPVLIRRGAWLGQNVVICPGVTVGAGAVVGANSVVNSDIPDYCIAVGSPARVVKSIQISKA